MCFAKLPQKSEPLSITQSCHGKTRACFMTLPDDGGMDSRIVAPSPGSLQLPEQPAGRETRAGSG